MTVTILVADPAAELRDSYQQMLTSLLPSSPKIVFVRTGREAATLYEGNPPDLVILDVKIADADVFETARRIWNHNSSAKIIFLAESHREWHLRQIKKLLPGNGLFGYIMKAQSSERIRYGIECVFLHNNTYLDPLTNNLRQAPSKNTLTDAEYETLIDMALGLTDRVIATRRNVSVRGIQNRITLIFQKLLEQDPLKALDPDGGMVNMRVRVVVEAIRRGLLDIEHFAKYERELLDFAEGRCGAM
ncbi:MAG: response regulator transcription factor [Candidatus Melainabacteria bacterium]|nr:response regulator transcription factor [Candidatus Melainabacteria bacterium]